MKCIFWFYDVLGFVVSLIQRHSESNKQIKISKLIIIITITFIEYLLCAKHCSKCFLSIIHLNPYNKPIFQVLLLSSFYKWEIWVKEEWNNLAKLIQLVSDGSRQPTLLTINAVRYGNRCPGQKGLRGGTDEDASWCRWPLSWVLQDEGGGGL